MAASGSSARGVIAAAGAAACFGVTVPLVQRFGADVGPWWTAALLYAGAAVVAGGFRRAEGESLWPHAQRVVAIALLGAAAAPALLAMGLRRIDGASASLLLGFEASFTVLFARLLYREHVGRRLVLALALMFAGGAVLVARDLGSSRSTLGAVFVVLAVVCWAGDSALMRPLADLPVARVVRAKSLVGVAAALAVALVAREPLPPARPALLLAACGALGYGASLRLYLVAQRNVGAARTAATFSVAPFFGAVVALALGQHGSWLVLGVSGALLGAGVALQATEPSALKAP